MNYAQKKLISSLIIALVVLVLFACLVVSPLVEKIRKSAQEYLFNQEVLAKLDQREFSFNDLERSYQAREDQLIVIEDSFLDQDEAVGLISTLENIAQETGNAFEIKTAQTHAPGPDETGDAFLSLRISLWGDYESLLRFMANLENSPYPPYRLLEIDGLSVHRLEGEDIQEGDLETVMTIKIYTK